MSDTPTNPIRAGFADGLGKWIALLASVVAVGQATTSWINGYWADQAEQKRAAQELALTEIRERSALASEYLKLVIAKDTAPPEKVTLLDALGSIEKHPLQQWARERHAAYKTLLARSEEAFQAQLRAAEAKEGAEKEEAVLRAEIAQLSAEAELVHDDAAKREMFRGEIRTKTGLLAEVSARVSLARLGFEGQRAAYAEVQQRIGVAQSVVDAIAPLNLPSTPGTPAASGRAANAPSRPPGSGSIVGAIHELTQKITAASLATAFPESAEANIEAAVPYLRAALQEFQVADKHMIAAIIATIAVETPRFENYEEPVAQAERYEGRASLGNTEAGDGVRFRGRGYVGLTGRANYTIMSARLGLGNRLVVSPEDAATPEVACRVIVAWFADRRASFRGALEIGDLGPVRRAVSGSATNQIERFTAVYNKLLATL